LIVILDRISTGKKKPLFKGAKSRGNTKQQKPKSIAWLCRQQFDDQQTITATKSKGNVWPIMN